MPWFPSGPETRMRSPGRRPAGDSDARGSIAPDPGRAARTSGRRGRARRPWCRRRRSRRRPPRRPRRSRSTSARRTSASRPSSRISERLSASGRAPAIARSLTVPLTASSPIEPPGKRSGLTTKLSVVSARSAPTRPASPSSVDAEGGREQALDQRLRRLAAGAVRHRDPLVLEPRALGARGLDDPEDPLLAVGDGAAHLTRPPSRARSGRSCSRRRRRPPARPCRCRSRARACTRCRTPCTPTA